MTLTGEVVVTVYGHPKPKGSMKCVGRRGKAMHALVNDRPEVKPWQDKVAGVAAGTDPATQRADADQPVVVRIVATLERPLTHYGTGRNRGVLKPWALAEFPTGARTGDSDKLGRLVCDALEAGGVLHNDAQVVDVRVVKVYAEATRPDALATPGVVVRVRPVALP